MNRKGRRFFIVLILLSLISAFSLYAEPIEDRVKEISIYGRAEHLELDIKMVINKDRDESEKTLKAFISREKQGFKILLHIIAPAYLNRMKYLSIRDTGGHESRWLKTSQVIRRLSEKNYADSLFGSDFTVEDLSELSVESYTYSDMGEGRIGERTVSVFKAVPKKEAGAYSSRLLFIDEASGVLMKSEFYDSANRIVKVYNVEETQSVNQKIYPKICVMETIGENSRTILHFNSIKVPETIPDRYFNKGNL